MVGVNLKLVDPERKIVYDRAKGRISWTVKRPGDVNAMSMQQLLLLLLLQGNLRTMTL